MSKIVKARAWCNNEVAFLAWETDGKIKDCLGFMVTRIHLDSGERRILPAWVAFETQSNPEWEEQDTSVWPIQKFSWRDLTLRRSRDTLNTRPGSFRAKYEIISVGLPGPGRKPVPPSKTAQPGKYKGKPIPLFVAGEAFETNEIEVTNNFGEISVAFTNGILSTQNLRKQLLTAKGRAPSKKDIDKHIKQKSDAIREFLAGDVLPALRSIFERVKEEDGILHMALYELTDPELLDLLKANHERLHLILSTAGNKDKTWDVTNAAARADLSKLMGNRLQHRMFNNSSHIGHNKFAVLLSKTGEPKAVWTGSTNWTQTGLCAQTNNTLVIDSPDLAAVYDKYWTRLHNDKLAVPKRFSDPNKTDQGDALRQANMQSEPLSVDSGKTKMEIWFSPNTAETGSPKTRTVPPDLGVVFDIMKRAKDAIFFLVFNPGRTDPEGDDINTIVSAGIQFGRMDPELLVIGAISDPTAVPGYVAPPRGEKPDKSKPKIPNPAIFSPLGAPGILMIRAAAINDLIGDFQKELLSAGHAIIHDKTVVIDPMSETDCVVITGSHNLGFKASYANDENMLIIRGNRQLALAYAVHVLDVHEHYKFRAVLEEQARKAMLAGKPKPKRPTGKGFLDTTDAWQQPYINGTKGRERAYFLR